MLDLYQRGRGRDLINFALANARDSARNTMIKTILVPATGEQTDFATFGLALSIARELTAHIDVLHVRLDAVDTAVSMISDASGGMLVEGVIDQLERDAREREAEAKRLFDEFCSR